MTARLRTADGGMPAPERAPRCGRVMAADGRAERGGEAVLPGMELWCGRPAGHNGPCRSQLSVARGVAYDQGRRAAARAQRGEAA